MTAPAEIHDTWTTQRLRLWMIDAFRKRGLDSPEKCAELLLCHVLGCKVLDLYTHADRPATPLERNSLRELVARAIAHEPVQYLVGEWWFFGLPFKVDRRVLIPRPATETIVEHILQHHRARHGPAARAGDGLLLADICTGSGCIAVALLKNLPGARAVATDISADALAVARENAARHGVLDRLDLLEGDLLDSLDQHPVCRAKGSLDYLAANPPYIPDHEWDAVAPNVKDYEPSLALRGGPDGLAFIRPLIERGPSLVKPGGLILIETADSTAETAVGLLRARPDIASAQLLRDVEGLPRVIVGRRA